MPAAALGEVLGIRDRGDHTAMAVCRHTYGVLTEEARTDGQETDCAAGITATEFERVRASAREGIT
ncbi:hypothetical protein [Kitasatospora albolonga]|uniref:hypothetical protein n=1 Tax=Kitasatospora albolonga TaxID=68173 RepID=UPI00131CD5D9